MLLRNNTRVIERVIVDLYFDDNTEKHVEVAEKDIVSVAYNDNGYRRTIEGKVTKIVPNRRPPMPADHMYHVEYGHPVPHKPEEGYLTIDGSGVYHGNRVNVYFSHILDFDMVEKYDETLIVKTVSGNGTVQKIRINEETNRLEVSKDGIAWTDVSTLIGTDNVVEEDNSSDEGTADNNTGNDTIV